MEYPASCEFHVANVRERFPPLLVAAPIFAQRNKWLLEVSKRGEQMHVGRYGCGRVSSVEHEAVAPLERKAFRNLDVRRLQPAIVR